MTIDPAAHHGLRSGAPSVAIIGGGISGLAAAHRLRELAPELSICLLEQGPRLGGVLQTERDGGYLLEQSADNFITNLPWGLELCRRLGLADELLPTNPAGRRALVVHRGRLVEIPPGFTLMTTRQWGPIVRTPLLSLAGKLRLAAEVGIPRRRETSDESFGQFARRRLGREAFERLVQPLVSGIYTADPEKLSMQAALPRFVELERQYGSLARGMVAQARQEGSAASDSGARYSLFVAPRGGMASLVDALTSRLPAGCVAYRSRVESVRPGPVGLWRVDWRGAEGAAASAEFQAVIVAAPAPAAARIIQPCDASLAGELEGIAYAPCSIVLAAYRRDQLPGLPRGFGFVVPEIERRRILSCSFASEKFPGRAPTDEVLLRVFVGGACHADLGRLPDDELRKLVRAELAELLGAMGEPRLWRVRRWEGAMPQYHLGHTERVRRIRQALARWPGLFLAGNAYEGVGVPQCIHSGEQAAEAVVTALAAGGPGSPSPRP